MGLRWSCLSPPLVLNFPTVCWFVVLDFVAVVGSLGFVCSSVSLFGSKGSLCLAVCCPRGLLVRGRVCAGGRFIRHHSLQSQNLTQHLFFFAILVSSSCANLLGSVYGE
jgi:hypothetical protein